MIRNKNSDIIQMICRCIFTIIGLEIGKMLFF